MLSLSGEWSVSNRQHNSVQRKAFGFLALLNNRENQVDPESENQGFIAWQAMENFQIACR